MNKAKVAKINKLQAKLTVVKANEEIQRANLITKTVGRTVYQTIKRTMKLFSKGAYSQIHSLTLKRMGLANEIAQEIATN